MEEQRWDHLKPLNDYITGFWKIGGIPLVLVGLGAANLFVPTIPSYPENEHFILTAGLFLMGLTTWVVSSLLAYKRWKSHAEIAAHQEREILNCTTRLLEKTESDSAILDARVDILLKVLKRLRERLATSEMPLSHGRAKSVTED